MKVMTIVGTRPEIIRLSRVMIALDKATEHVVVHTGQNWDPLLRDVFFQELGLRDPDYCLDIETTSLGKVMGGILIAIEPILESERPDAVLVLGDTNSSIAALMAKRLGIPVFHMEAGNRCFDENVPEETNRRMIDHVADFNLCYTEHARRNLLAEGLSPRRLFVTGSPLAEVLNAYQRAIQDSDILSRLELEPRNYLLVSMHREENIDNANNLSALFDGIGKVQKQFGGRVIISTHPRLRNRLSRFDFDLESSNLELLDPFGYMDFNQLQLQALCVLSDSGTISEESAILGFPAVTIRNAMERPEALDAGSIVLTGLEPYGIERAASLVISNWKEGIRPSIPSEYTWQDCSNRVVRLIVGLSGVHAVWANLVPKEGLIREDPLG
jgi:UDP-N-acetyl-L-fucosamine synthase